MQTTSILLLLSALVASGTSPLLSQTPVRFISYPTQQGIPGTVEPVGSTSKEQVLPYTAKFKGTLVQVQTNGTTTTQESIVTEARDSHGRTAVITREMGADGASFTTGQIRDSVSGMRTTWDSRTKKALVLKEPQPDQRRGCWRAESGLTIYYSGGRTDGTGKTNGSSTSGSFPDNSMPLGPTHREELGKTAIEGVEVHGVRLVTTIPARRIGNDQAIVYTSETWYAPSLGLVLRSNSENPPTGKLGRGEKELISLDRRDPDPVLFRPPAGYQVMPDEMARCKE